MSIFPRLFVYEVYERTGPAVNEFYCYVIYSSKTHHIIVVWRDWPILLWSDELTEQAMVEKIRKREVSS